MKTITLKNYELQFIFATVSKVRLHNQWDLAAWYEIIEIMNPVLLKFEDAGNKIVSDMTENNKTLKNTDPKSKVYNQMKKDIKILNDKLKKEYETLAEKECSFEMSDINLIDLNWFLTDYLRAGTRYDATPEMRGILDIRGMKVIHKVMCMCSDAIEKLQKIPKIEIQVKKDPQ